MTNLIDGQPSTSNLRIDSCTDISYTAYRFRTKKTYNGSGPGCHAGNYWHGMPAYCSGSMQLRKGKVLEVEAEKDHVLVSLSTVKYQ